MLKELFARFRKPKEPVVDEKKLEEERKWRQIEKMVDIYYKKRNQRLEDICQHFQLSREELKAKMGITEEMIVDFESNPIDNYDDSLKNNALLFYQLLKHANVNPVYLLGGSGEKFLREDEVRQITGLDFGGCNAEAIFLITFLIVSKMFRTYMLAETQRVLFMSHESLLHEIEELKSKMEEKKG